MSDPRDTPANDASLSSTDVDEMASRLLDGNITVADIPAALRDDVIRRRDAFGRQRQALSDITESRSHIDTNGLVDASVDRAVAAYRRQRALRRPRTIGVAAAAASVLVLAGMGLTRVGSDEPMDFAGGEAAVMVASDSVVTSLSDAAKVEQSSAEPSLAPAPDEAIVEFGSAEELRTFSEAWTPDEPRQESSLESTVAPCQTDPAVRLLTRNARFRGRPVEIYRADTGDIIVYAQSDCSVLLRLGA